MLCELVFRGAGAPAFRSCSWRLWPALMLLPLALTSTRGMQRRLRVLRGVSGAVAAGEALLVTGSNGSGKSPLLRCLAALRLSRAFFRQRAPEFV